MKYPLIRREDLSYAETKYRFNEGVWTTREGDIIVITNMNIFHLRAAIKMLEEQLDINMFMGAEYLIALKQEWNRRNINTLTDVLEEIKYPLLLIL